MNHPISSVNPNQKASNKNTGCLWSIDLWGQLGPQQGQIQALWAHWSPDGNADHGTQRSHACIDYPEDRWAEFTMPTMCF